MMDAQVDAGLGDSITYKVNGNSVEPTPGVLTIPAFLINDSDDGEGYGATITPQRQQWRLKVHKQYLPAGGPSAAHSVESPKLDGVYRPGPSNIVDDGSYWICELQKAPV